MLLTPAALNQRLSLSVLDGAHGAGFTPIRHRLHARLSPDAVTAVFQVNRTRIWSTYRYRLLDRLFQAGPALALLLAPPAGADPEAARAGLARSVQALGFLEENGAAARDPGLPMVYVSPSAERCVEDAAALLDASAADESAEDIRLVCELVESGSPRVELGHDAVLARLRCAALLGAWEELDEEGRRRLEAAPGAVGGLASPAVAEPLVAHLRGGDDHLLADLLRHDFRRPRPGFAWWRLARAMALYNAEPSVWDELVLLSGMVEH